MVYGMAESSPAPDAPAGGRPGPATYRDLVRAAVIIALCLGRGASASAQALQHAFDRANQALFESIGRSLPIISASAGFSYRFDFETGTFVREGALSGQLFVERPDPIGKRRLNVSLSYQRVVFDRVNGKDLDH